MSWPLVELQELALQKKGSIVSGPFGSNIGSRFFVEEGVPVIRGNNLTKGEKVFIDDGFVFLTESKAAEFPNCIAVTDDLIFTAAGSIGQVGLIPKESRFERYVISNKQLRVRLDKNKVMPLFVYYWISSKRMIRYLEGMNNGGAVPLLNLGIIKKVPIPFPTKENQEFICKILSAYDDLIENNRRRIQLLEQSARLLYKEWFVHLRFPGHEHVKITDGVPEGWERVPLEKVCDRITDGSHSSPKSVEEGFPMASVKDMHSWGLNINQCRKIGEQDYKLLVRNDCKPRKNDVLIAKDGSYLKHTFVVQEEIDLVILSSIAILRPNHLIDPHLLNFILRDPQTKIRMAGYVSGVALPRIILKEFRGFKILLPSENLQELWAVYVDPIAKQCHQLGKHIEILIQARDLLLPRVMNGEIAV